MAAMIASKLLLVIIFMIGVSVMEGAGISAHPGPGQQLTQVATGSLILLLAGFAPWLAIKMFHFTGDALHTAHASAAAAPSGARAVLGAPQKVNTMHSQATHAANKFSGSGPGTPACTQPPKESGDSLKGALGHDRHPGGPASQGGTTTRLPAATTAKPVGAAALPSATGTGSLAAAGAGSSAAAGAGSSAAAAGSLGAVAAPVVVAAGAAAAKKIVTATADGVQRTTPAPPKSPTRA